jgi:hypothetical protein
MHVPPVSAREKRIVHSPVAIADYSSCGCVVAELLYVSCSYHLDHGSQQLTQRFLLLNGLFDREQSRVGRSVRACACW